MRWNVLNWALLNVGQLSVKDTFETLGFLHRLQNECHFLKLLRQVNSQLVLYKNAAYLLTEHLEPSGDIKFSHLMFQHSSNYWSA